MTTKSDFFSCWFKLMKIKSWLKNIGMGVVKNVCSHSGHRTLKLAPSQWKINGTNWFFIFNTNSGKLKFTLILLGGHSQNEHDVLGHGALKSAVSQEWIDEMSWFIACWHKFRKAKSYFNNYWLGMVKNGPELPLDTKIRSANDLMNSANWWNDFFMLIKME